MKPTTPKLPAPPKKELPSARSTPASDHASKVRTKHAEVLPGVVYGRALAPMLGEDAEPDACAHAVDVFARMAPRDPAEEMLVAQLLFAHSRVMRLTELANRQTSIEGLRVVHEYADRASNTYRRLMLALAEYRRPPRAGDSFTAIRQANIAGQQVVMTAEDSRTPSRGRIQPLASKLTGSHPLDTGPQSSPIGTVSMG